MKFVRGVVWLGIVLDAISAAMYCAPRLLLAPLGLSIELVTPAATYLLFHAGIFMAAWTILLAWVLADPIGRRFVLLLTVLITAGMLASAIYLLSVDGIVIQGVIPLLAVPVIVGSLFSAAFIVASRGALSRRTGSPRGGRA